MIIAVIIAIVVTAWSIRAPTWFPTTTGPKKDRWIDLLCGTCWAMAAACLAASLWTHVPWERLHFQPLMIAVEQPPSPFMLTIQQPRRRWAQFASMGVMMACWAVCTHTIAAWQGFLNGIHAVVPESDAWMDVWLPGMVLLYTVTGGAIVGTVSIWIPIPVIVMTRDTLQVGRNRQERVGDIQDLWIKVHTWTPTLKRYIVCAVLQPMAHGGTGRYPVVEICIQPKNGKQQAMEIAQALGDFLQTCRQCNQDASLRT